jgi:hypothetical protein
MPPASGIIGHSEGGMVVPLAATMSSNVRLLVMMVGTAFSPATWGRLQE